MRPGLRPMLAGAEAEFTSHIGTEESFMPRIFTNLLAHLLRPSVPRRQPKARLRVEHLEARTVPTGSWTPLATPVPALDGAQTLMLLSDGTVIAHGGGGFASNTWYRLTPDSTG